LKMQRGKNLLGLKARAQNLRAKGRGRRLSPRIAEAATRLPAEEGEVEVAGQAEAEAGVARAVAAAAQAAAEAMPPDASPNAEPAREAASAEPKWAVLKLLAPCTFQGEACYRVKWKGYSRSTIEPRSNLLRDIEELVLAFDLQNQVVWEGHRFKWKKQVSNSRCRSAVAEHAIPSAVLPQVSQASQVPPSNIQLETCDAGSAEPDHVNVSEQEVQRRSPRLAQKRRLLSCRVAQKAAARAACVERARAAAEPPAEDMAIKRSQFRHVSHASSQRDIRQGKAVKRRQVRNMADASSQRDIREEAAHAQALPMTAAHSRVPEQEAARAQALPVTAAASRAPQQEVPSAAAPLSAAPAAAEPKWAVQRLVHPCFDAEAKGPAFKVRWRGFKAGEDTVEPRETLLRDVPELVEAFETRHEVRWSARRCQWNQSSTVRRVIVMSDN